jgi:hypothetical protein
MTPMYAIEGNTSIIDSLRKNYNDVTDFLKDPFQVPQQIVLKGTLPAASVKTHFYMGDAIGMAALNGSISESTGIAFVASGVATVAVIKEFLKTHALIIGGYNFNSSDAAQLSNNLKLVYSSIDGNTTSVQLFSAQSVSNLQNNPNLLNVDQPFVWTNACALDISATADALIDVIMTFTFKIAGAVPYGLLGEYLNFRKIPARSKLAC